MNNLIFTSKKLFAFRNLEVIQIFGKESLVVNGVQEHFILKFHHDMRALRKASQLPSRYFTFRFFTKFSQTMSIQSGRRSSVFDVK